MKNKKKRPAPPKRGGQGEPQVPQYTGLVPCLPRARAQMQFSNKVQLCRTLLPLPAPYPRAPSLALRAIHLVAAQPRSLCEREGGYPNKFPWELVRYIGGTASPLYERQRFSCRSGSARYDRWHRPRAATDAPRRRCGSCPTGRPADDGCPMRSSRSSPERLPESASCR